MATTHPHLPHDTTRPPACSWRGLLVDSARTFWPVPTMELLLTVMARYHFNVLHWHLTDNTGWRMRVPGYPMLTAIGGNIPRQPSDWYDPECAPGRKGSWRLTPAHTTQGFYSDANIRHLVNFAAARNIRIVPEISIPSRAGAAIRAYPHLGNPGLVNEAPHGVNQTLWPSAASLNFVEAAFHHACSLFPSPTIHIGGATTDWAPWESDSSLIRAGLTSGAEIERLFIDRALRTLHFHGRRAAAWDGLTKAYPTPPPGTTLLAHRPGNAGRRAAESSGAPWVLADADILTLSHPGRTNSPLEPAHTLFNNLTHQLRGERLKGVEAVAWSSTVTTPDILFYHLLPRLLVIAEAAWHGEDSLPWDKLAPLVEQEMAHLRRSVPYWNPQRP